MYSPYLRPRAEDRKMKYAFVYLILVITQHYGFFEICFQKIGV